MKNRISIYTALLLMCLPAFGATPSFLSFDTNDFTVLPSISAPQKIRSKGTSGTNVFNTIYVTNLYATNFFVETNVISTNLYITNINVQNITVETNTYITTNTYVIINGDTNAVGLWINDVGNYIPSVTQNQLTATNIIGVERLTAYGAFLLGTTGGNNLAAGTNDVSAYQNSALWLTGADSDPANSIVRLDSGNGQGHILLIQNYQDNSGFTIMNGAELFNSAPNSYQILQGDWVTSTKGDSLLLYNNGTSWTEVGRMSGSTNVAGSSFWENVGGVLRPLGHSLGTNQFTIAESTGWTGTGTNAFLDDGTFGAIASLNPTDGYLPYRFNAYSFEDSPFYVISTNAAIDSQLIFGPGTTNVLYRNGSHLFYTNEAANVDIKINNGSGKTAAFGLNAGGQAELRAEGTANAVSLSDGTDILTLFSNGFYPATYPISLGSTANPWGPNFYMAGFVSGTNYSRLYLNHSGTNGSVVFDSQANGTAGASRGFLFQSNGVTIASIAANSGYDGTGTHFLSDDGTYKAGGGGGGTTINPTDGYVPYRVNGTTFADSPWFRISTNKVGFNTTNQFLYAAPDGADDGFLIMGHEAMAATPLTSSSHSRLVSVGPYAGNLATSANGSTFVGWYAGAYATNITSSVAVGMNSGAFENGDGMTTVGASSGPVTSAAITGTTAVGETAGRLSKGGSYSTFVGYRSGYANGTYGSDVTPIYTTSVGAYAGMVQQDGTGTRSRAYSTFLGAYAGTNTVLGVELTNVVAIGFSVPITNSNEIVIGNANNTRIFMPMPVIPTHTPASSSETNYVGAITWDSSYIYVWTATNVNKRATLNAW